MKKHRVHSIAVASGPSTLCGQGREKGSHQRLGRRDHLLVDRSHPGGGGRRARKANELEDFFAQAPRLNLARSLISGVVCGIRVEDIGAPLMKELRYLDKLIDELAKGKAMEKILRK